MNKLKFTAGEQPGTYVISSAVSEEDILLMANSIARRRLSKGVALTSPTATRLYIQTLVQTKEHEVFGVIFMDNQNKVIVAEELFRGTIDSASVYPREVVKRTLELNSAALIFYHNHPSGEPEPSRNDRSLTERLIAALRLVDVRVLDHIVACSEGTVSFAERGYL